MIVDVISIIASVISVILAINAICFAKKEAQKSQSNYEKTKELLNQIDKKTELTDRSIQFIQRYMLTIINKLLDNKGYQTIDIKPLSMAEIDEIIEGKTAESREKIREMEETINNLPRVFVSTEEPVDAKDGDIWLKY